MAANVGHPNLTDKNHYVSLPRALSYSILHLFVLKDRQVDLHPKARSHMHWSVIGIVYSVLQSIACGSHWSFLPPHWMLPHPGLTSNHLHYRHQLRTVWLSPTLGDILSPGLCLLLHDCIYNISKAFLHCICSHFHLCCSPGPINWTCQAKSNIPCTCIGEPHFARLSSKEQDCFPQCQDHSFDDSFFETILEHVGNEWSTPGMGRQRFVVSPSPRVTLMWMQ